MTRKDFELIARTLKAIRDEDIPGHDHVHNTFAYRFSRELRSTNPNFDGERFLRACGVEQ